MASSRGSNDGKDSGGARSGSDVDHHMGPGFGAADQYRSRIRRVEWFFRVVDLAFFKSTHTGMTDARPAAVVRTQIL